MAVKVTQNLKVDVMPNMKQVKKRLMMGVVREMGEEEGGRLVWLRRGRRVQIWTNRMRVRALVEAIAAEGLIRLKGTVLVVTGR